MATDSISLVFNFLLVWGYFGGTVIAFIVLRGVILLLKYALSHLGIPIDKGFDAKDEDNGIFSLIVTSVCFLLFVLGAMAFIYDIKVWGVIMMSVSLIANLLSPLPSPRRDGEGEWNLVISFMILVLFAFVVMFIDSWKSVAFAFSIIIMIFCLGWLQERLKDHLKRRQSK